mmetsp:Transcript_27617/g.82353  ORF Transcript_27617/g.82353 Transcript_27617/m.82353 type:complete len:200 (+) Transcript_27617:531-1130(+)
MSARSGPLRGPKAWPWCRSRRSIPCARLCRRRLSSRSRRGPRASGCNCNAPRPRPKRRPSGGASGWDGCMPLQRRLPTDGRHVRRRRNSRSARGQRAWPGTRQWPRTRSWRCSRQRRLQDDPRLARRPPSSGRGGGLAAPGCTLRWQSPRAGRWHPRSRSPREASAEPPLRRSPPGPARPQRGSRCRPGGGCRPAAAAA